MDESLDWEYEVSEGMAYANFAEKRWSFNNGNPICLRCKCQKIYHFINRLQYKCSECDYRFTVTSGTMFASSKLPWWKKVLILENQFSHPTEISNLLDIEYKAAWVLFNKIKEALTISDNLLSAPVSRNYKGYFQRDPSPQQQK